MPEFLVLLKDSITTKLNQNPALSGTILRLLFHDCVPFQGCDGCVNLNLGANAGLEPAVDALNAIFDSLRDFAGNLNVTRADVWTFAALFVVEKAQPDGNVFQPPLVFTDDFRTGRTNCEAVSSSFNSKFGPEGAGDFPGPDFTTHELINFMAERFGYSMDDTVAVMGAHTLGQASLDHAGFSGQWVNANLVLGKSRYSTPP